MVVGLDPLELDVDEILGVQGTCQNLLGLDFFGLVLIGEVLIGTDRGDTSTEEVQRELGLLCGSGLGRVEPSTCSLSIRMSHFFQKQHSRWKSSSTYR